MNGLVMLLPHGYEGQTEHECKNGALFTALRQYNMQMVNRTTPATPLSCVIKT